MITCPICHKFVKHISTIVNGLDEVVKVNATCKKHGLIDADYDSYDEVVGEPLTSAPKDIGEKASDIQL